MTRRTGFTAGLGRLVPFPEICPACRGPADAGFCAGCASEFRRVARPCPRCALPTPVAHCPREWGWHVDRAFAPFEYAYPLDYYLQALKFGHGRALGRALALLVARALAPRPEFAAVGAPALVPVPLHRKRHRARGYNQATEIGRALARELGTELLVAGIARPRAAPAQSGLAARERRRNIAGAFRAERSFDGRHVMIVDDVVTTGATVDALARALRGAGAARVDVLAVARTIRPHDAGAARNT